jgi:hypothetical protein
MAAACFAILLIAWAGLQGRVASAHDAGRVLSDDEMAALFGDDPIGQPGN